ncbi:MAG: hypothetical protein ACK5O7_02440 [Holosporales bacterium]
MASTAKESANHQGWFAQQKRQDSVSAHKKNLPQLPDFLAEPKASTEKGRKPTAPQSQQPHDDYNKDLHRLRRETERHLNVPRLKEKWVMGRFSFFGLALGLALMGVIFFTAGFLLCFVTFPPASLSGLAIAQQVQPQGVETTQGYAQRSAQYTSTGDSVANVLEQAENRALQQSIAQGRAIAQDTASQWINKIRDSLGPTLGTIFSSVAQPTAQTLIGGASTEVSKATFGPSGRPSPGPTAAPSPATNPSAAASNAAQTAPAGETDSNAPTAQSPTATTQSAPNTTVAPEGGAPQSVRPAASPSTPVSLSRFSVTVQTTTDSREAYALYHALKERGYSTYIVRNMRSDVAHFEVRLGDFTAFSEAENVSRSLRTQMDLPARIVLVNSEEDRIMY